MRASSFSTDRIKLFAFIKRRATALYVWQSERKDQEAIEKVTANHRRE